MFIVNCDTILIGNKYTNIIKIGFLPKYFSFGNLISNIEVKTVVQCVQKRRIQSNFVLFPNHMVNHRNINQTREKIVNLKAAACHRKSMFSVPWLV